MNPGYEHGMLSLFGIDEGEDRHDKAAGWYRVWW